MDSYISSRRRQLQLSPIGVADWHLLGRRQLEGVGRLARQLAVDRLV
ncbi:hypothetical protein PssvBMR4_gp57 [Pseudomonas phage MR4]|uniref:Uncharacterized protein n=1 Tax=Pseudomonas phage MR4 TaxID=2711171 RepID=A0A6M3TCL6_9CAUD|nr:hypothetical protein PssvBMR4_gp57 [Pseudomonas phage MR4]